MSDGAFAGCRALVTGGASGIGLATATLLAEPGASVAVPDRDTGTVPSRFAAVAADVTDDEAVRTAVAEAVERLGGLDILVNNAGVGAQGTVEDNGDEEWHRVFDVNVVGLVRVTRACLPYLRESEAAAIVNTCSIAATAGLPHRALYSATKGAVLSAERAALEARQPLGRLVSAAEVAEAIVFLASPAAASTTGTALAVDGGMQGLRLRPAG